MKIKSILLTILTVIALSACESESLTDPVSQEEGYLILTLANPATKTSGGDTDEGTQEESAITSLKVIFTNEAGIIAYVASPSFNNGVTERFKIALGDYYVYALVNSDIDVEANQNINRVIEVAAATDATKGFKDGKFMMVNEHNSSSENAGVEAKITTENSITNPAKIIIYVDRVACKIVDETTSLNVSALAAATNDLITDVVIEGYVILNVNKEFNLIQQWNKDNTGGITLDEEVLSTPLYPGTGLIADQYFLNIGEYTTLNKDGDGNITGITDETLDAAELFVKTPIYTTENRPTIINVGTTGITAGRGETTGVIYKVKAQQGGSDLETFYKYKNDIYTNIEGIQALPEFDETLSSLSYPELRARGIQVYENGIMYYTYFIYDPNVAHQHNNEDYYGVFRNSTYQLKINSISSLGDDVPGGAVVDPEKQGEPGNPPISTEDNYIEVSLKVNKWILNTIEIEF